jgi:hypothetical protein
MVAERGRYGRREGDVCGGPRVVRVDEAVR